MKLTITKFPRVFVLVHKNLMNKTVEKVCTIIYSDRVETYKLYSAETKKSIEESNGSDCTYEYESIYGKGWNASHEVNLCLNNGYREVHAGKETELELGGEQK